MFVEYMALQNQKEATALLDASAKMETKDKEQIYILKENDKYQAIIKNKKGKENRWFLYPNEKGINAKREKNKAYILALLVSLISAIVCVLFTVLAFIYQDNMAIMLWLALIALLVTMLVSWRKLFNSWIALKIFLIRIL